METVLGMSALSVSSTGVDNMYIVYKTINMITGEYYVGSHKLSEDNRVDDYLGSGKKLLESISKYGKENFIRETLAEFTESKAALELEHKIIKDCKSDKNCLNGSTGGQNFEYINANGLNNSANNYMIANRKHLELMNNPIYAKRFRDNIRKGFTEESRARLSAASKGNKYFLGKHHTDETKRRIGSKTSISQAGSVNSQYGTYWITDGKINKKWNDSLGDIPEGFYRGRKIK